MIICQTCGKEIPPDKKNPNRKRKFCSRNCSNAVPHGKKGPIGGNEVTYSAFHYRVVKARGKPSECEWCGLNNPIRTYEWANLEGRYEDLNDYVRLCVPCHRKFDRSRGGTRWRSVDGVRLTSQRPRSHPS